MTAETEFDPGFDLEPERYELLGGQGPGFAIDRRGFLAAVGGGLVVLCLGRAAWAQQPPAAGESGGNGRRRPGGGNAAPREVGAWVRVGDDGTVTAFTGKVEVGQNARTSLTQAVAQELRTPVGSVRMVMGDTGQVPFDMGTFGSRTTPTMLPQLRRAAAAAREALVDLAAKQWGVDRGSLAAAGGAVKHAESGRSVGFGELTKGEAILKTIDDDTPLTPADRRDVLGTSVPKVDGRAFVTGSHEYTSDMIRPGGLVGKVLRPPASGATLKTLDARDAKAIDGVTVVRDGDFVGVAAPDEATAAKALAALRPEWSDPGPTCDDQTVYDYLKVHANEGRETPGRGSVKDGLAQADETVEASYRVAYVAHAPLEPRAALAEWSDDGRLTVWTGTQRPFGVRSELAQAFGVGEDKVRVIVPDTGGGYGGKHTGEVAVEAARLSKAAGKPVKRVWTREEEFSWAYFRPAGLIEAAAGARKDGTLTAWAFVNYNAGSAGIESPYETPNRATAFRPTKSPLRQGSYRGLASTANHFARETLLDELARKLGVDPLELRLKNLKDERLKAVFKKAAGAFGWGDGRKGVGIAGGTEKGGYVATCAEVAVDGPTGAVRVVRLVSAFECGAVVNPDHLKNQVEGGVLMGLGGALFEAVKFDGGKVLNPRFSRYRVPRFRDLPEMETVLIDRPDLASSGAGESPIVAVAPAIGNAVFDACGTRLRSLPLAPDGVKS